MSAQAGLWNFDGKPVDIALLERFASALDPFGPDGGDAYRDASVGMVYRAFHTAAESRLERQPFLTSRGNVCTWDGRLDNREELIHELSDEVSADHTDVAIAAAAFERWGDNCFRRLIGDWAVAIWAEKRRELILAVDYMAIRHLFYYWTGRCFWWSTILDPLVLASEKKFHIDDDYIAGYFANDPDSHLTPYQEIRAVPSGHYVRICPERVSVERYWGFTASLLYKTDAEYEEHFRYVFRQAVRRRLRSDSPVLAELSGGLDSSAIVCMADDILARQGTEAPSVDTLSYYNQKEPQGDDSMYFPKVEEKRRSVGAHIDASVLESAAAPLRCAGFCALPGAVGIGHALQVERALVIRQGGYRAVLSGLGGDELFGGIPNPIPLLADLLVQCKLFALSRQLVAWSLVKRQPLIQLLCLAAVELVPASLSQYFLKNARIEPWINLQFAKRTHMAVRQLDTREHFGLMMPTRRSYIAGVFWMANKTAKYTPRTLALEESRYPYLDRNLVEFVLAIPASQLLRPRERRSLVRRSLAGLVPKEILARPTKQFAARTPVLAVERNWDELRAAFAAPLASQFGYVHGKPFLEKLKKARTGEQIHIARMLKTISLEFWLRDLARRGLLADADNSRTALLGPANSTVSLPFEKVSATSASKVAR